MIILIMLYGCEVWASEYLSETEILHYKVLKHILVVRGRTTYNMGNCVNFHWQFNKSDDWLLAEIN